jgi:hypothetical protein
VGSSFVSPCAPRPGSTARRIRVPDVRGRVPRARREESARVDGAAEGPTASAELPLPTVVSEVLRSSSQSSSSRRSIRIAPGLTRTLGMIPALTKRRMVFSLTASRSAVSRTVKSDPAVTVVDIVPLGFFG